MARRRTREAGGPSRRRVLRIRIGFGLIIVSWLPIAQVVIWLTSDGGGHAERVRAVIWSVQVVIGLVGVAVAGAETVQIAKSVGWRKAPAAVWRLLRTPDAPVPR